MFTPLSGYNLFTPLKYVLVIVHLVNTGPIRRFGNKSKIRNISKMKVLLFLPLVLLMATPGKRIL